MPDSPEPRLVVAPGAAELEAAFALRHQVFVAEQGVPLELERDDYDLTARHVVLMVGPRAVATGRLLTDRAPAKIQRVAVDADHRGARLGARVMQALEDLARQAGAPAVTLASQLDACGFYQRLGYVAHGETFEDAGIEHVQMTKLL